jgi:glutamyl-tRNA synthetase
LEPMAITSLLSKLGTSDSIVPRQNLNELVADFDLSKISRATPKFDIEELKTINAKILHMMPYEDVQERLQAIGLGEVTADFWNTVRANLEKFSDIKQWWRVAKGPITPVTTEPEFIKSAAGDLPPMPWDHNTWGLWTQAVKTKTGRKGKDLFMPLRLALTGTDHGPEMKLLLPMIGPQRAADLLAGKVA